MSDARKCNRCEKFFDPNDIGEQPFCWFESPTYQTGEDYKNHTFVLDSLLMRPYKRVDLCPKCAEDHRLFMDGCPLALHELDFDQPDREEDEGKDEKPVEETQGTDEENKTYRRPGESVVDEMDRMFTEMCGFLAKKFVDSREKHRLR